VSATATHIRTCPFCEATCGLEIEVDAEANVLSVRGDAERLGLADGSRAVLRSAAGQLEAPVEVTDSGCRAW